MGVSNIFEIVQILPNRAKHHICELERCASLTDLRQILSSSMIEVLLVLSDLKILLCKS